MKKHWHIVALAVAVSALALAGCATKPKAPAEIPNAEPSSIQAEATGLAPSGEEHFKSIEFALLFGSKDSVASWSIAVVDQKQKTAVRTQKGGSADIPEVFSWDGKDDSGKLAAEGSYSAELTVDYAGKYQPGSASSKPFILDLTPPSASFSPSPAQFAYAPDGVPAPISVTVSVKQALAKSASWTIDIFDAAGNPVKSLSGALPASQAGWDGKLDQGGYVAPAKTYPAVLTVSDEFGNKGTFSGSFTMADVPNAEASAINTRRVGFSPLSASVKNSLDLLLTVGSKTNLQAWEVDVWTVENGTARTVRSFKGGPQDLTDYVRWDGKDDSGALVPEASYYATLSIDYGKAYKPVLVKSRSFSVVTTPPAGSITVDPPTANLSELGPKKPVQLTVQAKSAFAQIASWVMAVYDPSGASVMVFNGNWPNNKVAWDGKTVEGGSLIPGSQYTVEAKVQDEYGNVGDLKGALAVEGLTLGDRADHYRGFRAGLRAEGRRIRLDHLVQDIGRRYGQPHVMEGRPRRRPERRREELQGPREASAGDPHLGRKDRQRRLRPRRPLHGDALTRLWSRLRTRDRRDASPSSSTSRPRAAPSPSPRSFSLPTGMGSTTPRP